MRLDDKSDKAKLMSRDHTLIGEAVGQVFAQETVVSSRTHTKLINTKQSLSRTGNRKTEVTADEHPRNKAIH